jgi:hypothetical protein
MKKISCHTIFCSHKFHKIVNYFIFEMLKRIIWANFQRIILLFTQKIVNKLSKIWVWDPGSGENIFWIPDPGVTKAPDPDSQHCIDADLDPAFHFDADPDPTFHFDSDPDPTFQF